MYFEESCVHLWGKAKATQDCLGWIEQCFTSPPTQYRWYGRRFLQVKRPNQQYDQSTEGTNSTQTNQTYKQTWTQNTASPLVYNNMGWLGDGSHRGQGCQAWTAVGLPPRYPQATRQRKIHHFYITAWRVWTDLRLRDWTIFPQSYTHLRSEIRHIDGLVQHTRQALSVSEERAALFFYLTWDVDL